LGLAPLEDYMPLATVKVGSKVQRTSQWQGIRAQQASDSVENPMEQLPFQAQRSFPMEANDYDYAWMDDDNNDANIQASSGPNSWIRDDFLAYVEDKGKPSSGSAPLSFLVHLGLNLGPPNATP